LVYSTRAFVRQQYFMRWVSWNSRYGGGPIISVFDGGIKVSAPQGTMLESRTLFFDATESNMWMGNVGWSGTPLFRRDCIRLRSGFRGSAVDVALRPEDGIEPLWTALLGVGVNTEPK
jgi:hypothetical protein